MKFFLKNEDQGLIKITKKIKKDNNKSCLNIFFNYKDYYYYYHNNSDFIKIFLNLIFEKGKKKKIKLFFSKIFNYFYYIISYNNQITKDFFNNIHFIKYKLDLSNLYYTINIIIMLAVRDLYSSFKLIYKKKHKKKQKKIKKGEKKYFLLADYVFEEDRKNVALKWLHLYSGSFLDKKFVDRLFKSIMITYSEGCESYLFEKKIAIYEFYMESKKKKNKF